jgi:hypothetical protein
MAARKGRVTHPTSHQTGRTHTAPDKKILAERPGMRISAKPNSWGPGGKPYWEARKNRSDRSKKRRL